MRLCRSGAAMTDTLGVLLTVVPRTARLCTHQEAVTGLPLAGRVSNRCSCCDSCVCLAQPVPEQADSACSCSSCQHVLARFVR
jgi:hypothetical protein